MTEQQRLMEVGKFLELWPGNVEDIVSGEREGKTQYGEEIRKAGKEDKCTGKGNKRTR